MLLQPETLYVYAAIIHDMMDKSSATYVTIWTINKFKKNNMEILCEVSDRLTVHTSMSWSSENFLKPTLIQFRFLLTKIHDP